MRPPQRDLAAAVDSLINSDYRVTDPSRHPWVKARAWAEALSGAQQRKKHEIAQVIAEALSCFQATVHPRLVKRAIDAISERWTATELNQKLFEGDAD